MAEPLVFVIKPPKEVERLPGMLRRFQTRYLNKRVSRANEQLAVLFITAARNSPTGPRRITGQYVEAWRMYEKRGERGQKTYLVTNPSPQWRRLEYGFVGTDSLGRRYNQAPRPHIRFAKEATLRHGEVVYGKAVQAAWKEGLRDL